MSPRPPRRDLSLIQVDIDPNDPDTGGLGSGRTSEGGGPLQGGLHLQNRFRVVVQDPAVPYIIKMTLRARDGRLACEEIALRESGAEGPAVTGAGLRSVVIDSYLIRVREELGGVGGALLIAKRETEGGTTAISGPVSQGEWRDFEEAQALTEQRGKITAETVADLYRDALASPDPSLNRRPTQAVADRLGISRGHASKLLTQARRDGLLGSAQRGKAGVKLDSKPAD